MALLDHTKDFRFLVLPAELRNEVYRYALPNGKTFTTRKYPFYDSRYDPLATYHVLGVLFTSKQIYAEAATIFYATNRFFYFCGTGREFGVRQLIEKLHNAEMTSMVMMRSFRIFVTVDFGGKDGCGCDVILPSRIQFKEGELKGGNWTRKGDRPGAKRCLIPENCQYRDFSGHIKEIYDLVWEMVEKRIPSAVKHGWKQHESISDSVS